MGQERLRRWQGITLTTLFVGYAGYYVCRSNLSVATPLILAEFADQGWTKETIGGISSVGIAVYSLGKISNGVMTDFLGGRLLFLLGMAASTLCTVFFGIGSGLVVFTIAWACNRYVQSMGWGALTKIASRWFPVSVHASVMGFLCMSYLLGDALGRLYLSQLLGLGLSWRGLFLAAAATLGAIGLASIFTLRSSPRDVGEEEPAGNPANVFGAEGETARPPGLLRLLLPLLTNGTFWLVCLMNMGLTLIRETFNQWTPTFLLETYGLKPRSAGMGSMVFPLVGAVAAMAGGSLSARFQGKHGRIAAPSMVFLVLALAILGTAPRMNNPTLALVMIGGVSFFMCAPYSFCSGVMALDLGGKQGASTAAGLIDSAGYLGAIVSGYGIGSLAQNYGWQTAFLSLAGVAGITTVATVVYWFVQEFKMKAVK
jgi:OPA family glycerol-3-phosphate transporter-like MFS transporter